MTELGIDDQTAAADVTDSGQLAPAVLAARVATLADRDTASGAGSRPVWDRLAGRRRRSWLSRLTHLAAWCATLGLLSLAALRIGYHDAAVLLIWLNAFTLYAYLPAYVILAVAVWRRRWLLAAASAAVVVCHVAWIAPDFQPATPYEPASAASIPSRPVRIFYANVRATNPDRDGILNEIATADPDVVVLVEFHRPWLESLRKASVMKPFVYGTSLAERSPGEVVVFSKLPVRDKQPVWAAGRVCKVVDIPLADDTLRLFCLHGPRPNISSPQGYDTYWKKIMPVLAEQPAPLVVIGDFNATQHSLVYQRLTSQGLRSAHADRGRGYATTWPNWELPLPPIRIDQALLSSDVECLEIAEGVGTGSDHKPLILDIRIHPAPGRPSWASAGQ